ASRASHVLAFQRYRRRQHDVRMPCARGPSGVVKDHRIGAREGFPQSVQILMVMERIAARPINELYVRVSQPPPVVVERFRRMHHYVADTRNRDEIRTPIAV